MTDAEKIVLVKAMTDESDDNVISAFLSMAGEAINHYADPHKMSDSETVLSEYGGTQCRLTAYWLNKRGAEGEIVHLENGISRHYESGDVPDSLLKEIVPKCGVVS